MNSSNIFIALLLLLVIFLLYSNSQSKQAIDRYLIDYMNGFWAATTIKGQCILHLDNGSMRIVETDEQNDTSTMKKCTYRLVDVSSSNGMDQRTYRFIVNGLSAKKLAAKYLTNDNLKIDLYPIENIMIIHDPSGDLLTLHRDSQANLSMITN